jgi:hypothetical protein
LKIQHRVPILSQNMTGKIDPEYQREVDATTHRLERDWANAQKSLEAATRRAERAERVAEVAKGRKRERSARDTLALAWATVELRRAELDRLGRIMSTSPAAAIHRGDKSFRPVPVRHGAAF